MQRQSGSSAVILLVLALVVIGFGSVIVWLTLRSSDRMDLAVASDSSPVGRSEWDALQAEVAELRREVETLRRERLPVGREAVEAGRKAEIATRPGDENEGTGAQAEDPRVEQYRELKAKSGWASIEQMRKIEDPAERRSFAENLLENGDFWARHGAVLELLDHDPNRAIPELHGLLAAATEEPKGVYAAVRAVDALDELEGYAVEGDLRRIYDEIDLGDVDLRVARALDRRGDPSRMQREVERFQRMLHGEDPQARLRGIDLLGHTRSRIAVPHLLPLLDSDDVTTRIRTVEALGEAGSRHEVSAIEAMLNDPVAAVRDRAVEALMRLRGRP